MDWITGLRLQDHGLFANGEKPAVTVGYWSLANVQEEGRSPDAMTSGYKFVHRWQSF